MEDDFNKNIYKPDKPKKEKNEKQKENNKIKNPNESYIPENLDDVNGLDYIIE